MMKLGSHLLIAGILLAWIGCGKDDIPPAPTDTTQPDMTQPDTAVPDTTTPDTTVVDADGMDTTPSDVDIPTVPDTEPADSDDAGPPPADGVAPDTTQPPATPEEAQLLLFINHVDTTKNVLVGEVGLKGQTPGAILDYRAGADGLMNTADDVAIMSVQELDELPYVGGKSLEKIWAFSRNWSESNTDPVLELLNAPTLTLVQLDVTLGLDADAASSLFAHRSGVDGIMGTADDQFFVNRTDVLDVTYVGKAAVATLEQAAGLGSLQLLDSGTAAGLVDVAMNDFGEALIVGIPVGLNSHALWFTPFSEEAYTSEDEPYEFIDHSELMPEALTGAAYDASTGVGYAVGEAPGLYVFDPFIQDVSFVSDPNAQVFSDVTVDGLSGDVYAASADSAVIVRFDGIALASELIASVAVNALAYTGNNPSVLTGVGDAGTLTIFDAGAQTTSTLGEGEVLYDIASLTAPNHRLATGAAGLGTAQLDEWTRWPTRSLRAIRGSAVSPDGDTVLMVGEGGTVLVYFLGSGVMASLTAPVSVDFSAVAFASDGSALIVGDSGVVLQYLPTPVTQP